MPIAPPPLTYQCPQCGWQKTVAPKSDALAPGRDFFSHCPQCRSAGLETKPANPLSRQINELTQIIKKVKTFF